ncbi:MULTISPECIES: response regulator [Rhizobiaceae]|uniref:DNA-binding NtrC family response regulator n=1 Tax=Aliirhizobium cellulosilyticum TaxID=393664 RepID=A0A7W6WR50_9HYPH|nr:response regulator [Rhizobium cellulosilyticum]MBB4349846.1 DNA-binding NtrC family response regulator [Rhizobium cellulosilyticum]MBB4414792.1 DNA-binding NtrC family response regulator [Rhizobium cellulosilyticum]MBB4449362.1 DNA-binding NtrC family response regulator [Rhizobium cellulosilyticum]
MQADEVETILVASSDALQRSIIAKYLRECGYSVIEATGFDDAKIAIGHYEVDVVVSDTQMQDGTGFDLSTYIRSRHLNIEIILTQSLIKTAQVAGDLCEQGPLDQPYHPQRLVDEIKRLRAFR